MNKICLGHTLKKALIKYSNCLPMSTTSYAHHTHAAESPNAPSRHVACANVDRASCHTGDQAIVPSEHAPAGYNAELLHEPRISMPVF